MAFSLYRHVDSVMSKVSNLQGSEYSVNWDFPSEISRARKLLWPKLKQTRQLNSMAKVSMGYPAKIIMNGSVTEDLFPKWDTILCGSRIDAEHPSQLNLNRGRANTPVRECRSRSGGPAKSITITPTAPDATRYTPAA